MNLDTLPTLKNNRHLELCQGRVVMNFGKNAGEYLEDVASMAPHYLQYLLTLALPSEVLDYLQAALDECS